MQGTEGEAEQVTEEQSLEEIYNQKTEPEEVPEEPTVEEIYKKLKKHDTDVE